MTKLVQAFLSGAFFTFFIDFFFFLGLKLNYIDHYNIDLYYNPFFADNQNIYVYMFFTIFFGFLVTYVENAKLSIITIGTFFILTLSTLFHPIGFQAGTMLFTKKDLSLHDGKHVYRGDLYYNGRTHLTFYDYELDRIVTLDKEKFK